MLKDIDRNLIKDYAITLLSFVMSGIGSMIIYNQLPLQISTEGSEIFAVYKKASSLLFVALIGGMGVAIPKYTIEKKEAIKSYILLSGFLFSIVLSIISAILFLFFPDFFGGFIIGKAFLSKDVLAIFAIIFSGVFNGCIYGYLRGVYNIKLANLLVIFISLFQLISIYFSKDIYSYIYISSTLVILICLVLLFYFTDFLKKIEKFQKSFLNDIKELYIYGLLRVPGDFSIDALTSLPVIFTTLLLGINVGGQMGFAMTIFGLIMTIMSPINFILLPKASLLLNQEQNKLGLKKIVFQSAIVVLPIIIFTAVGIMFFAPFISTYVFHSSNPTILNQFLKYVAFSAIPYSIYSLLRGIIDAAYKKPINSFNAMVALGVFVAIYFIFKNSIENIVLIAMFIAYLCLAILTYVYYVKIFKKEYAKA